MANNMADSQAVAASGMVLKISAAGPGAKMEQLTEQDYQQIVSTRMGVLRVNIRESLIGLKLMLLELELRGGNKHAEFPDAVEAVAPSIEESEPPLDNRKV